MTRSAKITGGIPFLNFAAVIADAPLRIIRWIGTSLVGIGKPSAKDFNLSKKFEAI